MDALVSTDWLAAHLGDAGLRIVDVRWYLDPVRRGRAAYNAGHIPGAIFLDVEEDLSGPGGQRGGPLGRHPWPPAKHVSRVMGAAGIGAGVRVVAYDDAAGSVAARVWYLLRAHGHDSVSVLDGGFPKWQAEKRPVTTDEPAVTGCSFAAALRPGYILNKDEMQALPKGSLVLDARVPERYRGDVEPIDPRAGHIPGARNAPYTANLTTGRLPVLRSPEELKAHYAALGAGSADPVAYCGSGVNACHDLLALHLAGFGGRLYAGSWSEWSSDPALPVATGDD